jgi:predicted DNA binding CopG/RHH family protein
MNSLDFDNMNIDELTVALELDEEERELLESIENDEWISIPNEKEEIKHLQEIARNQLARQRIEVQMSMQDADKIYDLASQFDQSVSSFAQDIIHKYLRGELVEKT